MDVIVALSPDRTERLRLNGSKVGTLGRRPRTDERARVCQTEGCRTILSRYNRQERCWQHEPARRYLGPIRGRRPAEISVRDLDALSA